MHLFTRLAAPTSLNRFCHVCMCVVIITLSQASETLELDVRAGMEFMCHVWRHDLVNADCDHQYVNPDSASDSASDSVCVCVRA